MKGDDLEEGRMMKIQGESRGNGNHEAGGKSRIIVVRQVCDGVRASPRRAVVVVYRSSPEVTTETNCRSSFRIDMIFVRILHACLVSPRRELPMAFLRGFAYVTARQVSLVDVGGGPRW